MKNKTTKKGWFIVSLVVVLCLLPGCSKAEATKIDISNLEEVPLISEWVVPSSLDFLEEHSQVMIVGKVLERMGTDVRDVDDSYLGGITTYRVEVQKVLNGTMANDVTEIRVIQPWWVEEGNKRQIVNMSHMRPLKEGDTWVFFLLSEPGVDGYSIAFDENGCWPLAYPELLQLLQPGLVEKTPAITAYWRSYNNEFDLSLYYAILEKYQEQITP